MAIKNKASFFADDGTRSFTRKTWFRLLGWPDETRFRNLFGPTLSTLGSLVDDLASATLPGFGIGAAKADITARTATKLADASVSGTNLYPIAVGPHQLPIVVGTAGQVAVVKNTGADANADTYEISLVSATDSGWVDIVSDAYTGPTNAITWSYLEQRQVGKTVWIRGGFFLQSAVTTGIVLSPLPLLPTSKYFKTSQELQPGVANVNILISTATAATTFTDVNGHGDGFGKLTLKNNMSHNASLYDFQFSYILD